MPNTANEAYARVWNRVQTAWINVRSTKRVWRYSWVALLIAVVVTVFGIRWFTSSSSSAKAIENVLQLDKQYGDANRQRATEGSMSEAESVVEYLKEAHSIDLSGCPPDFTDAYLKHLGAWESMSIQLQLQPSSNVGWFWEGLMEGLGAQEKHDRPEEMRTHLEAITSTWTEVLSIATRDGAKTPNEQIAIIAQVLIDPDQYRSEF